MPSLREYVLTLKKYNPKAEDRLLKIYLLKAGWPIADIEKAFVEANTAAPSVMTDSVSIAPVTVTLTTDIEVAAPEIQSNPAAIAVPANVAPIPVPSPAPVLVSVHVPTVPLAPIVEDKPLIIDGALDTGASDSMSGNGMDIHGPVVSSASILAGMSDISGASPRAAAAPMSQSDRPQVFGTQELSPQSFIGMPGQKTSDPMVQIPSSMQSASPKPKSKVGKKLAIWLLILILLGVLGFGYVRFAHGIYFFVSAPISKSNVLSYIASSIAKVDTAEYSTHVNFRMMPKEPGVESFDAVAQALRSDNRTALQINGPVSDASSTTSLIPGIATSTVTTASSSQMTSFGNQNSSIRDVLAAFPVDGTADLRIQGIYKKDANVGNDGKWHVMGDYSGEGLTAKFDIESVVKKGLTYIKTKAYPEMFFDIRAIQDKWISIGEGDTESVASALPWIEILSSGNPLDIGSGSKAGFKIFDIPNPRPANFDRQIARLVAIASEEGVLEVVGEPQKIIRPGAAWHMPQQVLYSYQLQLNFENFMSFIERSNTILKNEFGAESILPLAGETKQKLMSREFEKFFNYFVNNGYFKMTVDKSGMLVEIAASLKLVSDEKQALVNADISFDNINRSIDIEAPKAEMTFSDAYVLMSGQSKELLQLKRQVKAVEAIKAQIASYQAAHAGDVPDTLSGLSLPNLPFATSSYAYKKTSKTAYLLSYQIVLPPLPSQFYELPESLIGFDSSTAASSGTDLSMQYLKFVNGKNTATEKTMSVEADASRRLDSDRDRITNGLEQYIGTNITKKDTDEDGVSDYEELQKGGNPTGPGSWVGTPK